MPKVILKLSVFLVMVLSSAGFAAEVLGKQQPPNPALRGFSEGCPNTRQSCWYGVLVNQTRVADAWNILQGQNYLLASSLSTAASKQSIFTDQDLQCGTYFMYEYRTVNGLIVKCKNLLLGDWLNIFGMPDRVGQYHDVLYYHGDVTMRIQIIGELRPNAQITEFMFPVPRPYRESQYDWQGFAPRWRYCQLNIDNPC